LGYSIIDFIIDSYYPVLELMGDVLNRLEVKVIRSPVSTVLEE
jgi:Mg2+ and Co2+ transporter CorA